MSVEGLLGRVWSWLPAFRAVAEAQHLPTASQRLAVTPSALSRTIRLLEEEMGQPLFDRVGRRLVLNTSGARLLSLVQDAMRRLGAGLPGTIEGQWMSGPLHLSSAGVLTPAFVLPALRHLRGLHPALVPCLHGLSTPEANRQLTRGEIEVAFYSDPIETADLAIEHLGAAGASVYCAVDHPIASVASPTLQTVTAYDFVAPFTDAQGRPADGWPVDTPRRIGMITDSLRVRLAVCLEGHLIAVLPDAVARPGRDQGLLRRVPLALLPATDLYAAWRPVEGPAGARAAAIVDAVRGEIARHAA